MNPNLKLRVLQMAIAFSLLTFLVFAVSKDTTMSVQAGPLQSAPAYVYVCDNNQVGHRCNSTTEAPLGPYAFESDYVATVLKNEWGSNYMQALYAGAVAIRTFAQRNADGCGAINFLYQPTYNGYPVERNDSQAYFPRGNVPSNDTSAANNTAGLTILRFNDNAVACAKYFANTGNPTGSYSDGGSPTDTSVLDSVNHSYGGQNPGMSQNGSIAWTIGASALNWPQVLGKYYTRIGLSAGTNNTGILIPKNNYRWTWTDVTTSDCYASPVDGSTYYCPRANTPTSMRPNCVYPVPFTVFNGSKVTFYGEGSANPTRLSYHWYNVSWQVVVWDGIRTLLSSDLGFGQQRLLQAQVRAPSVSGVYYLRWDLVQEGITWHEWKNATPQGNTVSVSGTACP
jgi:hypothetical protein